MSYKEQIKSGKWQAVRLKVFERDNFKCTVCSYGNDLQVHHLYYKPGLKIFEYEMESLKTVCGKCHEKLTFDFHLFKI